MFSNISKMLFFFMMITGTLISISSNSWFNIWLGLEINLLSFIPLMVKNNNLMSSEASLKYFIIQAFASSILLFSILFYMINFNFMTEYQNFSYSSLMIYITIFMKMGAAPFHFWFPNVMEGMDWMNSFILMTWQKIGPMLILSYSLFFKFYFLIIILSVILGSLGGLNQTSLRKIMAFSSINHMGWMLSSLMFNEMIWFIYFLTYTIMNFSIIYLLNNFKLFYLNQLFSTFINSYLLKFMFLTSFLSLGGLPPFLGFFPKWMIIQLLSNISQYFIIFLMIIMTMITLYFYLRISFSAFMLNYENMKWNFKLNFNSFFMNTMMMFTFFSLFSLFIFIYFIFILF